MGCGSSYINVCLWALASIAVLATSIKRSDSSIMASSYRPLFLDVQAPSDFGGVVQAENKLWAYAEHRVYFELRRFLLAKADHPHKVVVNRTAKAALASHGTLARRRPRGTMGSALGSQTCKAE